MSGVKNLRAMFENKGETSPPAADDRGRSPGANSTGTESPRPISRIRTNFIAIEKDGRLGLQRDTSRDSSVAGSTRKLSGDLEPPTLSRTTSHDKPSSSPESKKGDALAKTSLKDQPIPESPRFDSPAQMSNLLPGQSANSKAEAPPINPDNNMDVEEPNTRMVVGGPTDKSAVTGNGSILPSGGFGEGLHGTGGGKERKGKEPAKEPTSSSKTSGSKATAPKPVTTTRAAPKATSSTVSKPQKSPVTSEAPKLSSKTPERNAAHPPKTSTPRAATSTTKAPTSTATASGSSSVKRPPPLQSSPKSTGFVKPKVKSPTRPVKLPAGLTTHTAASATKFNVPREALSRAGSVAKAPEGRSHSRASISTTATRRVATETTGKTLKRQSSNLSRPRPSIGPPPKPASKDHPQTKKEAKVDEGFLARMMRPTQASAQKTAEKGPVTPPRKTAAAPTAKKAVSKIESKLVKPVKKVVAKAAQAASSSSTKDQPEQSAPAQETAPLAEKVEKAKEAVKAAEEEKEKIEGPAPVPEEAKPEPSTEETTAQEVAPVAEQATTAEEIVQVAKEIEGPVSLPEAAEPESASQETPAVKEIAPLVEQLESAEEVIEVAKAVDGEVPPPVKPEAENAAAAEPSEAPEKDAPDAPDTPDAPEEAPSEATLVNGTHDKVEEATKPAKPAEPTGDAVETEHGSEDADSVAKPEAVS